MEEVGFNTGKTTKYVTGYAGDGKTTSERGWYNERHFAWHVCSEGFMNSNTRTLLDRLQQVLLKEKSTQNKIILIVD